MESVKAFLAGVAIFSLLVFSACATKVIGLQADPSFTYREALEKRFAVGGVTHTLAELGPQEKLLYSDLIRTSFAEQRPGLFILSAGVVAEKLGKESYGAMIEEYRTLGTVSDKWLSTIDEFTDGFGYVIFARIVEDAPKSERTRTDNYSDDKKFLIGYTITAQRTRTMTVSLEIYSLESKAMVWGGSVTKSSSDSRSYKTKTGGATSTVLDVVGSIMTPEEERFPYPPMPSRSSILRSVFSGFGENLPDVEKK